MTKMCFGIQTSLNHVEWREIEGMWRFLDHDTQFYSAWTFDHFIPWKREVYQRLNDEVVMAFA
jgi:hypothetical protein